MGRSLTLQEPQPQELQSPLQAQVEQLLEVALSAADLAVKSLARQISFYANPHEVWVVVWLRGVTQRIQQCG
jgi:hypothetical protein